MEDANVAVLVDAKEEYTKQLISILKPCIYQGIKSIFQDAKDICHQDNTPDNVLMVFQDLLSRIPKWSQDIINKEFERISNASKCDYIDDLLKVVYVSHIKVLTIVHSAQRNKKISLKVPSGSHFIHLCYTECAREFWKDPYLFSDRASKYEQQKNMRDSENMIGECIAETIRKQLPVRHILKEFLNEPDEEIEEEEDIKEQTSKKYLKKLETVVKKELKTTGSGGNVDIDLIRKVIQEEMANRISNDNIDVAEGKIKKELVNTVVEKIVEQSNEEAEQVKPVVEEEVKPVVEEEVKPVVEEVKKEEKPKKKKEFKIESLSDDEGENGGLESLIFDEISGNIEDTITIDEKIETLPKPEEPKVEPKVEVKPEPKPEPKVEAKPEPKAEPKPEAKAEPSPIMINNIDEINLNLDELDSELGGEVDLEELRSKDLEENGNEVKDPDIKFLFFKDAKSKI